MSSFSVSLRSVNALKSLLAQMISNVKSSHRTEALARALGWQTNAALRAELHDGRTVERPFDQSAFLAYLQAHGFRVNVASIADALCLLGTATEAKPEQAQKTGGGIMDVFATCHPDFIEHHCDAIARHVVPDEKMEMYFVECARDLLIIGLLDAEHKSRFGGAPRQSLNDVFAQFEKGARLVYAGIKAIHQSALVRLGELEDKNCAEYMLLKGIIRRARNTIGSDNEAILCGNLDTLVYNIGRMATANAMLPVTAVPPQKDGISLAALATCQPDQVVSQCDAIACQVVPDNEKERYFVVCARNLLAIGLLDTEHKTRFRGAPRQAFVDVAERFSMQGSREVHEDIKAVYQSALVRLGEIEDKTCPEYKVLESIVKRSRSQCGIDMEMTFPGILETLTHNLY